MNYSVADMEVRDFLGNGQNGVLNNDEQMVSLLMFFIPKGY